MNEQQMPNFFDLNQPQPGSEAQPPAKPERKKRTPRKPPVETAADEAPKKRERKARTTTPKVRASRSTKVDLAVAISALGGLKPEEAQMVARAATTLGVMPKRSRGRIVAALARMFA